jgi:uncharacterized protein (TIGR02996 family)
MSAFPVEPALEAAVVSHADDDTPRLVYADWLDENGDPDRAAFIRVQCRLADLPPDDPDWCALDVQQDVLIHRLTPRLDTLRPPLPQPYSHATHAPHVELKRHFRRGFSSRVYYYYWSSSPPRPQLAVEALPALVANTTCRDVVFQLLPFKWVEALAAEPAIAHLRGLSVTFKYGWTLTAEAERAATFLKLVASPAAPHLRWLDLVGTPPGVQAVTELGGFPALRDLDTPGRRLDPELLAAPWLRGLRRLSASNSGVGAAALAAAGELPALHTLELNAADTAALAATRFPRLARLARPSVPMLLRDLQTLLAAPWFGRLHSLDLSNCGLGDRAAVAIAKHPVARNLRDLRLANNPVGKLGLTALSEPGALPELVRLDLSNTVPQKRKATEADVAKFLARLAHPKLQSLHLTGLPLNDFGALVIAKNIHLGTLRELRLGEGVTEHGLKALRACEHLRQTAII